MDQFLKRNEKQRAGSIQSENDREDVQFTRLENSKRINPSNEIDQSDFGLIGSRERLLSDN